MYSRMIRQLKAICLIKVSLISMSPGTQGPQWWDPWWSADAVTNGEEPNSKAIANVGQGKWMAKKALEALTLFDPTVGGFVQDDLYKDTPTSTDGVFFPHVPDPVTDEWKAAQRAPLQLGELKALAHPLYNYLNQYHQTWLIEELNAGGLNTLGEDYYVDVDGSYYPWNPANNSNSTINKAPANIGQLKGTSGNSSSLLGFLIDEPR